ncbi:hypothetical protein [Halobacteriovorax sp. JY17]|uniref:hypothetical protein n=1 Tax=Halobacteriovorax sp. JY17 TaxID=2014617 RepID=UPI000C47E8EF|nr:hypothetical protein [Halobacteriovorax sp. JY17]PIK16493.1 MAG: hypothetical protein CES88_07070 [Halobacteriovorax sp. JY17]
MDKLIAIYRYKSPMNDLSHSQGSYYLLHVLTNEGAIKPEQLEKYCYEFNVQNPENEIGLGPFISVDEITKFCFYICDEMKLPYISLHSMDEFNSIIEESSKVSDLLDSLNNRGNLIENISVTQRKSFLQKVFDRT